MEWRIRIPLLQWYSCHGWKNEKKIRSFTRIVLKIIDRLWWTEKIIWWTQKGKLRTHLSYEVSR